MLRKTIIALLAAATVGLVSPTVASARGGHGGFHGGGFHGGGFHGGGFHGGGFHHHGFYGRGFGIGSDLVSRHPTLTAGAILIGYYGYPYAYSGYDDGGCYLERRRVHTRHGWRCAGSKSAADRGRLNDLMAACAGRAPRRLQLRRKPWPSPGPWARYVRRSQAGECGDAGVSMCGRFDVCSCDCVRWHRSDRCSGHSSGPDRGENHDHSIGFADHGHQGRRRPDPETRPGLHHALHRLALCERAEGRRSSTVRWIATNRSSFRSASAG